MSITKQSSLRLVSIFVILLAGFVYGFKTNWYMSGLFTAKIRSLPKNDRIKLFRSIGLNVSPTRLRSVLLAVYPDMPAEEHELAHLIGETAYKRYGTPGFAYCDSVFTFACYHGVILAAIASNGYDEAVLLDLANGCEKAGKNRTADISCAHGIGHGLMWVKNYELIPSFEACDGVFIRDTELRFFCWDGVAMENVVRRGELPANMSLNPLESENIYAPCDSVAMQYQPACVREHVFLVRLQKLDRDTYKTSDFCLHFTSPDTRLQCFGALGGALYQDDPGTPDRIIVECYKVPPEYVASCIGVASRHYGFSGRPEMGHRLCEALGGVVRKRCAQGVGDVTNAMYRMNESVILR